MRRSPTPVLRAIGGAFAAALVGVAAAAFAHLFVDGGGHAMRLLWGAERPVGSARGLAWPLVVVAVTASTVLAAVLARTSGRTGSGRTGLHHIGTALAPDGDPVEPGPSLRATLVRAAGTFASSVGLVSIGRETAMIETGGAIGSAAARRARTRHTWAAAGVAGAFGAAYGAPVAALAYVDDHVGVRRDRTAAAHTVIGAAAGFAATTLLWGHAAPLPRFTGPPTALPTLTAVVLVPVVLAARALLALRRRIERAKPALGSGRWLAAVAVGAVAVGVCREAAGNGIEALQLAAAGPFLWAAAGLALVRLAGTLAALAAGVPGGVIFPTLAISAGWGLLTVLAVEATGVDLPGSRWDAMVLAMVAGVAIGLDSPWMAAVFVPELTGDYALVPWAAVVVLAAAGLSRLLDRATGQMPSRRSRPTVTPGSSPTRRHASSTPGM